MISAIGSARPGVIPNIIRVRGVQGRITVPVRPINTIYARFRHVKGIPDPEGGIPVVRLRILDTLIDRLLSVGEKAPQLGKGMLRNPEEVDSLVQQLHRRLQAHLRPVHSSRGTNFYRPFSETGLLIDLVA